MITLGSLGYAQNTQRAATPTDKIEQVNTIGDPKAKADIDTLMKKYKLTKLDDLSDKSPVEIFQIRSDLTDLLWASNEAKYHLDDTLVKFRDEVWLYADALAPEWYDRSVYTTVVSRWEKLAKTDEKLAKTNEKLAKTNEKLAKITKELEETKKVAKYLWVKVDDKQEDQKDKKEKSKSIKK